MFPGLFTSSSVIVVKGCVCAGSSTGASFTSVTVMAVEPVAVLNAVVPPLVETSTFVPAMPEV